MRRILHVSSIIFDPQDRQFHGTVVYSSPLGVMTKAVSAAGHPQWEPDRICKALSENLST